MKSLKLSGVLLSSILLLGVNNVQAEETLVNSEETLRSCVSSQNVCKLNSPIVLTNVLDITGTTTLDLNGNTITPVDTLAIPGGLINVNRGGNLTIDDSIGTGKISGGSNERIYAGVLLTKAGENADGEKASLTLRNGTIEGYYYGIVGNGNRHNTEITIQGGTVLNLAHNDGSAIYQPQKGTLIVSGGKIEGATGIEIRSGSLKVTGGSILGKGDFVLVPNGNGSTSSGVGIAIAQHTTKNAIEVSIQEGTIQGYYAVHESNPQNNPKENVKVNLNLTGGTYEAIHGGTKAVESTDVTHFIKGGTYNTNLPQNFMNSASQLEKAEDGSYVVKEVITKPNDELDDVPNTKDTIPVMVLVASFFIFGTGIYALKKAMENRG